MRKFTKWLPLSISIHGFSGRDWKLGLLVYKSSWVYGLTLYLGKYNLVIQRKVLK